MHDDSVLNSDTRLVSPVIGRRLSWAAIIAGVVIALSIQLLLNLLGIGIGASTINPAQGDTSGSGLAIGAGVWFVVSALISLFVGAWAASRSAGISESEDGVLQGFTTWGLTTIATLLLLTSAVGGLIGGSASLLGKAIDAGGHGLSSASPVLSSLASQATGITPAQVQQQAGDLVSDPRFQTVVTSVIRTGEVTPQDRGNLVTLVAQKQNIPQDQASQEVAGWQQQIVQAKQQASATAVEVANKAASGVSHTALLGFFALLLGAIAAMAGGWVGTAPAVLLAHRSLRRATV